MDFSIVIIDSSRNYLCPRPRHIGYGINKLGGADNAATRLWWDKP